MMCKPGMQQTVYDSKLMQITMCFTLFSGYSPPHASVMPAIAQTSLKMSTGSLFGPFPSSRPPPFFQMPALALLTCFAFLV